MLSVYSLGFFWKTITCILQIFEWMVDLERKKSAFKFESNEMVGERDEI